MSEMPSTPQIAPCDSPAEAARCAWCGLNAASFLIHGVLIGYFCESAHCPMFGTLTRAYLPPAPTREAPREPGWRTEQA